MWHFDKCRLGPTCAASRLLLSLETSNEFGQWLNSQWIFKRLAEALIRLRVWAGWSETAGRTYNIVGNLVSRHNYVADIKSRHNFQDKTTGRIRLNLWILFTVTEIYHASWGKIFVKTSIEANGTQNGPEGIKSRHNFQDKTTGRIRLNLWILFTVTELYHASWGKIFW